MSAKIGLLGGSFDPVHNGHLYLAEVALQQLGLDEVRFIPCAAAVPPQKSLAPLADRQAMTALAIDPYPRFSLDRGAAEGSCGRLIDTVRRIRRDDPQAVYFWLLGADELENLPQGKEYEELKRLVRFAAMAREGAVDIPPDVVRLQGSHPGSSARARQGDLDEVPAAVRRYIMAHYLYQESLARSTVSARRWIHVQSVAELCVRFAAASGVDERKARQAGLFHDCAKDLDRSVGRQWMEQYYPEHLNENVHVWHQYLGALYLRDYFKLEDAEVLKAVEHHALGDDDAPLSMIVYCADKLDPTRGYDSSRQIALCCRDLAAGFALVHQEQYQYLKQEGVL